MPSPQRCRWFGEEGPGLLRPQPLPEGSRGSFPVIPSKNTNTNTGPWQLHRDNLPRSPRQCSEVSGCDTRGSALGGEGWARWARGSLPASVVPCPALPIAVPVSCREKREWAPGQPNTCTIRWRKGLGAPLPGWECGKGCQHFTPSHIPDLQWWCPGTILSPLSFSTPGSDAAEISPVQTTIHLSGGRKSPSTSAAKNVFWHCNPHSSIPSHETPNSLFKTSFSLTEVTGKALHASAG